MHHAESKLSLQVTLLPRSTIPQTQPPGRLHLGRDVYGFPILDSFQYSSQTESCAANGAEIVICCTLQVHILNLSETFHFKFIRE
jgi:hypothetical protein